MLSGTPHSSPTDERVSEEDVTDGDVRFASEMTWLLCPQS